MKHGEKIVIYMYRKTHESECISGFMGTSDVLKAFKIARAVGECNLKNFQNITSDHKSRNARAVHAIFCFLYSQQNHSVNWATLQALGAQYLKHFSMVSKMPACFVWTAITITARDEPSLKLF